MADKPRIQGKHVAGGAAIATVAMVAAVATFTAPKTAQFEGYAACPYVDKIGRGHPWTGGFGHTGPDVHPGECHDRAYWLGKLREDETKAARIVASCSPAYVVRNRNYWGAATDFTLNVGHYCDTSMARLFADNRPAQACDFFNRYVYSAGQVQRGLVRRRLFFSGDCMGRN